MSKVFTNPVQTPYSLLADIGGTNARFALEDAHGQWQHIAVLPTAKYPTLTDAIHSYLVQTPVARPHLAGIAIANPVHGDWVEMTNHHWRFSIEKVRTQLNLKHLVVVNDFTALSRALPYLKATDTEQIGGELSTQKNIMGLVGAGTGLGVSGLIPVGEHWVALNSEGGHVSFAPNNALERQILETVARDLSHVSTERLVSGPGLEVCYRALAQIAGLQNPPALRANEIVANAENNTGKPAPRDTLLGQVCAQTLHTFSGMLGSVAGNLALTLGATGGIYLGGGVSLKLGQAFDRAYFRQCFEDKGRFSRYLHPVPCFQIVAEFPAFLGVSAILGDSLHTI